MKRLASILALLVLAPLARATACNITASGPIQADGTLGSYSPFEADVLQIQGTVTESAVDDDEPNNSTVTVTSPNSVSVTIGMFALNAHSNGGTNTYAVRIAAGFQSKGVWVPGNWTWSMNYSDRTGYSCTATGSFTVQKSFASHGTEGFLRPAATNSPNLKTDGNGKAFFPIGFDWYDPYYNGGTSTQYYDHASIPALSYVNVSGTAVTYVSGVNFNTTSQPSNITPFLYICPALPVCTPYFGVTINSSTSITLPLSGGTPPTSIPAYLGFTRDDSISFSHATGNEATQVQAAQFYAQWGNNFDRLSMGNLGAPSVISSLGSGNWLGTGYNVYNWASTSTSAMGIPGIDQWFAAAHAAGLHLMLGNIQDGQPCASYSCTSTTLSNLQNLYAYESARWGAFYDVLELSNEKTNVPQAWVDAVGSVIKTGVSGIAGGNPADPYGHFFTISNMPSTYSSPYGPLSSPYTSDAYLNWVDILHYDNVTYPVYSWFSEGSGRCPAASTGNNWPSFNGEQAQGVGVAPSSQSGTVPNSEKNGPRIVNEQQVFNQCGGAVFNAPGDTLYINDGAGNVPAVNATWYDAMSATLQRFMVGLDSTAAPITVTLGGGCGSSACSYAALGSSNHIRAVIVVATGNGSTGVSTSITNPSVTLTVPAANMNYNWVLPSTGAVLASGTTTSGSRTLTYTGSIGGSNPPDLWLQLDYTAPPSTFASLLTTSTDLTCDGVADPTCSTWPMPANPGMGSSYSDPTWGTTTVELNVPSANTLGHVIPIYSRNQGFNSDNTKLLMFENGNCGGCGAQIYMDLYDATTNPPTPINRITTTDGSLLDPTAGDAYWANTDPNRIYYIPWGYTTGHGGSPNPWLQLRYVDVSTCTTGSCVLTPVLVHDFSLDNVGGSGNACTADSYAPSPITVGTAGDRIESSYTGSQGNMFDLTDNYFSFSCDLGESGGVAEIDLIRYQRDTDTVTTQEKWYNICTGQVPSGCDVWNYHNSAQGYSMFRMAQHPDANYITIAWLSNRNLTNATWTVGNGTSVYGPTFNFLGPAAVGNGHQDNGFDANGVPVAVVDYTGTYTPSDEYSLSVSDLTKLSTTAVTENQVQFPCSMFLAGVGCNNPLLQQKFIHISMTGTTGSGTIAGVPGFALISTGTQAGNNGLNVTLPTATTLGTSVTAGSHTVTPGSMSQIATGVQLLVDCCGASQEAVTVTGTTSSTFTATYVNTHTSSAPISNLSVGETGPYAIENIAEQIDTTQPYATTANFWRLGRVMSLRGADYNSEAHAFVNRDWSAYVWGANWNQMGVSSGGPPYANGYYTNLSGGTPTAATPTFSPAAGAVSNPTTITASTFTSGCGSYIYFDTNSTPVTNTTTYSVTTAVTLYAYVHGCPGYLDSSVGSAAYTISGSISQAAPQLLLGMP